MNKSAQVVAATALCAVMLGSTGCSLVETSGIDYSAAGTENAPVPAGAPALVDMTVTRSWPMAQASRVAGMDTLPDGRVLAIAAPDVVSGAPGALISIDPATPTTVDPATTLHPIAFGADYVAAQEASIQVARGWAVAVGPQGRTAISAGSRYGVLADLGRSPDEPGNYFGLATDRPGAPITPVTGACWFSGTGDDAAGAMTAHGSNTLERRIGSAAGPGDGRPSRVLMQAGPQLQVRDNQQAVQAQTGPGAPPRLAPAQELLVGGLADLACLSSEQVEQLHRVGMTQGLRSGHGDAVVAIVNRELSDGWFAGGVDLVDTSAPGRNPEGTHSSGGLVGQATAAGPKRLDAVAIDTGTGVAVAGFHVNGGEVPDDAQITSVTLDTADASRGWLTIAGKDRLYEFVIDVE